MWELKLFLADYGRLLDQQRLIPLNDVPEMKIQQEFKVTDLVATGSKLSQDDLELPLENLLASKFKLEVEVHAELFPDAANMWKISTEHEGKSHQLVLTLNIKL